MISPRGEPRPNLSRDLNDSPPRFALEYLSLIRPILRSDNQTGSDGIINHIEAFGFAALARSKPMMKTVFLPTTQPIIDGVREL
jgi:hypothetical protein